MNAGTKLQKVLKAIDRFVGENGYEVYWQSVLEEIGFTFGENGIEVKIKEPIGVCARCSELVWDADEKCPYGARSEDGIEPHIFLPVEKAEEKEQEKLRKGIDEVYAEDREAWDFMEEDK